jgi:hypothetical protein
MTIPGSITSSVIPAGLPTISGLSATNISQSVATLNATIDSNGAEDTTVGAVATVTFQWKYNSTNFSTGTVFSSSVTNIPSGTSASRNANITGLLVNASGVAESLGSGPGGDLWYWRVVATNYSGTTTSAVQSFTTWSLKTYSQNLSGTYYLDIPTVTPTGGSAQSRNIYSVDVVGGGAAASTYQYAGGAGGYSNTSSRSVSSQLTIVVGSGGSNSADSGSSSSITGLSSNMSSSGGSGQALANWVNGTRSGSSGSGSNNSSQQGGMAACFDTSGKSIIGATGGGGGSTGEGGNASCPGGYYYGGTYGDGSFIYAGGKCCYGGAGWGSPGSLGGSAASPPSAPGNGGDGSTNFFVIPGSTGLVRFQYYGP